ncbi:hypothetical protein EUTSA_v10023962mg, partial [Eutrema salsugineum]
RGFQPQDTDIILSSYPKSGTTWLKALTVALLERSKNHSSDHHPLLSHNPHGIVPYFELVHISSEAVLDSHATARDAQDPQGLFLRLCTCAGTCSIHKIELNRSILESMFKSFCDGTFSYGPFWEHLLSYWRGSLEDPKRVLFIVER